MEKSLKIILAVFVLISSGACMGTPSVKTEVIIPPDAPEGAIMQITSISPRAKSVKSDLLILSGLNEALKKENVSQAKHNENHIRVKIDIKCLSKGKIYRPPLMVDAFETTITIKLFQYRKYTENDRLVMKYAPITPLPVIVEKYKSSTDLVIPRAMEIVAVENSVIITYQAADYQENKALENSVTKALEHLYPLAARLARAHVPRKKIPKAPTIKE